METHRDVPDRGPNLLAALWTCCSLACVFLSLRVYCKFQRHVALQYDDYLLIVSWVMAADTLFEVLLLTALP